MIKLAELTAAALAQPAPAAPAGKPTHGVHPFWGDFWRIIDAPPGGLPAPTAPAAPVFTFPGTPTEPGQEYLTELITRSDLLKLANKLIRRPSDDKQTIGRALQHALNGEPFAEQGHRNKTAFQLAGEIVEEYPNCQPESVLACLSASVSRVQQLGSKLTEQVWLSMIERIQDERRARLNEVKHVGGKLGRALQARAGNVTQPMPTAAPGVAPTEPLNTLFILADGVTYLRRPEETCYRWALKGDRAIAVELANQFGTDNSVVETHNEKGDALPLNELMPVYASNAHTIVHDYSSESTTFDAPSATLHVGFPSNPPEPRFDVDVHNWLTVFVRANETDETTVLDLYDWVASCTREHIDKAATALVLDGETGIGKSRLAEGLAGTWGVRTVDLGNAVQQFNGSLLFSPFWFADERLPEKLTGELFRKIISDDSRLVEPKGREKVTLLGCSRVILGVNGQGPLQQIGGISSASASGATAERISYFNCTSGTDAAKAALERLMLPGTARCDMTRIVGHLRWVQAAGAPRAQRFLGARADKAAALGLLHQSMRKTCPALFDLLDRYAVDPLAIERRYYDGADLVTGNVLGLEYPLVTWGRRPWARFGELAKLVAAGAHGTRASDVEKALEALRPAGAAECEPQVVHPVPGRNGAMWKYRQLDAALLAGVLGVSLENMLSQSTSERLGQDLADAAARVAPGFADLVRK